MLSIKKLTNAKGTAHYFEKDNYYSEGSPEAESKSVWLGKGAVLAGYKGTVSSDDFEKVLDGYVGDKRLGRKGKDGEWSHTSGWDLTFSAPKSFSLMVELNKDKELFNAHEKAVGRVFDYLELSSSQTRMNIAGKKTFIPTRNLLAAAFHHNTSRELDPQIHTHVIVANATLHDGKWRALSSEKLFDYKKLTGKIYRECLSEEIKNKGYEIVITDRSQHFFEIKGVPENVIKHFSKRRSLIEEELGRLGMSGGKAASIAALGTRRSKVDVDHNTLHDNWSARAEALGFDSSKILHREFTSGRASELIDVTPEQTTSVTPEQTTSESLQKVDDLLGVFGSDKSDHSESEKLEIEKFLKNKAVPTKEALEAIQYGVDWITEREASFREVELVEFVKHEFKLESSKIITALDHFKDKGDLVVKSNMLLTTRGAIDLEVKNIELMKSGQGEYKRAASNHKNIDKEISSTVKKLFKKRGFPSLSSGQTNSLKLIMTTKDRFIGIQGRAGVGKTTMLGVAETMLTNKKFEPVFLAPTGAAASVLNSELKSSSATVDRWLIDVSKDKDNNNLKSKYKNQVWLVDEAGMLSSRQLNNIFTAAKDTNSKVVLVGDSKQLEAVEAGRPFSQLIDSNMANIEINEIRRQKDKNLLDAVYGLLDGNIASALEKVGGNISEETEKNRLNKAVDRYFDLGKEDTILIIPANKDRHKTNGIIREKLKVSGVLSNNQKFSALDNLDLRQVAKSRSSSYEKGNILRFGISNKNLGIERGEYFVIKDISVKGNSLKIESLKSKKSIDLKLDFVGKKNIKSGIEAYKVITYEMAEGDKFRWKRSDKDNDVINGQTFTVDKIKGDDVTILDENGIKKTFRKDDIRFKHVDYAYSDTVYSSQGKTAKNAVLVLESYRRNLINQKSTYVGLSRASHHAEIITDNKADLSAAVDGRSGENTTALEVYINKTEKDRAMEKENDRKKERVKKLGKTRVFNPLGLSI